MTNEEILKIAESVSINFAHRNYEEDLVEFARLVANIEREACAKICDSHDHGRKSARKTAA